MNNSPTTNQLVTGFLGVFVLLAFAISVENDLARQQNQISDLNAQLTQARAAQVDIAAALPAFKKDLGPLLLKMDEHNTETGVLASMAYAYARGEKGYELCTPMCTQGTLCEQAANAFRAAGECNARPKPVEKSILARLLDGDLR